MQSVLCDLRGVDWSQEGKLVNLPLWFCYQALVQEATKSSFRLQGDARPWGGSPLGATGAFVYISKHMGMIPLLHPAYGIAGQNFPVQANTSVRSG